MSDDEWLLKYIHAGTSICINICKYKLLSFGQKIKNFFQRMTEFPLNVSWRIWNSLRTKGLKSDYNMSKFLSVDVCVTTWDFKLKILCVYALEYQSSYHVATGGYSFSPILPGFRFMINDKGGKHLFSWAKSKTNKNVMSVNMWFYIS